MAPYAPAVAIIVLQLVVYPMPAGVWLLGAELGALGSLVALGLALVQRANRVLNFAQADLGTVPTAFAYGTIQFWSWPYLVALPMGLVLSAILGALIEFLIIRRFFKASRLVLMVATIGVSQLFLVGALLIPRIFGQEIVGDAHIAFPWHLQFSVGTQLFHADDLVGVLAALLVLAGLGLFLRRSEVGIAVRASAERSDRAAMLGIPVKRLNTLVWSMAAAMSFIGVFLRAAVLGLPINPTVSLSSLVVALTALILAGSDCLPGVVVSAVALGVLEQGVAWNVSDKPALIFVLYAAIVLASLLVRRVGNRRVDADETASWRTADDPRRLPSEVRHLPELRAVRWAGVALLAGALVLLGAWLGPADQQKAATVACFCLITLSVVVLTGWAGQVSLGQMSFVAVGAVGGSVAVATWHWDLMLALLFAGACGAGVAVLVGLPALRLRGPYLAVATLAFALASSGYLLNRNAFTWIPNGRIDRPALLATIDLSSEGRMYAVCVVVALLGLVAVHGVRGSRTGRVLRAVRGNERAAQAYGVRVTSAKLTAFAISGFLAGVAGCLLAMISQQYTESPYTADQSVAVFTAAVVGGVGSLAGAIVGAVFAKGGTWFLPSQWQLLPSAIGVLGVLMLLPGGLSELGFRARDGLARRAAARRGIEVPSLVADRLAAGPVADVAVPELEEIDGAVSE